MRAPGSMTPFECAVAKLLDGEFVTRRAMPWAMGQCTEPPISVDLSSVSSADAVAHMVYLAAIEAWIGEPVTHSDVLSRPGGFATLYAAARSTMASSSFVLDLVIVPAEVVPHVDHDLLARDAVRLVASKKKFFPGDRGNIALDALIHNERASIVFATEGCGTVCLDVNETSTKLSIRTKGDATPGSYYYANDVMNLS